jgi:hypothetical protein
LRLLRDPDGSRGSYFREAIEDCSTDFELCYLSVEGVALARAALDISPLCADAYVLLAEEEAGSQQDALAWFRQGVEAGDRALGDEFEGLSGHFWGFLQTRP